MTVNQRIQRRLLIVSFLTGALALDGRTPLAQETTAGGDGAPHGLESASDLTQRIERAVVAGSLVDLEAIKALLLERLDAEDCEAGWIDNYNLAYISWRICQLLGPDEKKQKRRLLKEAQRRIEERLEYEPDDAESHALRGSVIGEQIGGFFRGMFLGPKATKSLEKAFELDPDNPRVALQRAISYYFTPKTFGGGLDKAEQELRRARELFESETAAHPWPSWGRVDTLAWLGQVLEKAGRVDEARAAYEEALVLEPEHAWLKHELLPALDSNGRDAND
jgi:tetratricopeptide (TPR) repeat protein